MASSLGIVIRHPIAGSGGKVAYTGTAGSLTLPSYAQSVLLWCSTVAFVRIGGTATTTDTPVPANAPVILPVPTSTAGAPITVSAVQDSSGGNLYAIGMAE